MKIFLIILAIIPLNIGLSVTRFLELGMTNENALQIGYKILDRNSFIHENPHDAYNKYYSDLYKHASSDTYNQISSLRDL